MTKIQSPQLQTAIQAARAAGKVLGGYFGKIERFDFKGGDSKDLLIEADLESEKKIIDIIQKNFPEHNILSEEVGEIKKNSPYTWVIDPLDATANFVQGIPYFAVSIALFYHNKLKLGVLYNPAHQELFAAEQDKGATLNGSPITVSKTDKLSEAVGGYGAGHANEPLLRYLNKIVPLTKRLRLLGCPSLQLAYVAVGRLDFAYLIYLNLHDVASGIILVEEAGGKVSHSLPRLSLSLSQRMDLVGSNGKFHQELIKFLRKGEEVTRK